jgi:DNA-binding NarL/FixJ family response regulator
VTGTQVPPGGAALSVVLVDDSTLWRQALSKLLTSAGLRVAAELGRPDELWAVLRAETPNAVILDVRLPPTFSDEGITTAVSVRREYPDVGVLVLSTYAEGIWARRLFEGGSRGVGYLLKDAGRDVAGLVEAVHRVTEGGSVVDPEVITQLMGTSNVRSVLDVLSQREQEVLALMAEGLSNAGIGRRLFLSPRTVESHVASVFTKLGIDGDTSAANRRVLAVLTFLNDRTHGDHGGWPRER